MSPRGARPRRWTVERVSGTAAQLHGRALAADVTRTVSVYTVTAPALVLGSTQPDGVVDADIAAADGLTVVRRRSGGGAVLLEPGGSTWVDVVVPAGDPLWEPDVGRSFLWLGAAWSEAFTTLGQPGPVLVHRGGLVETEWSRLVCFAGLGPGEVTAGNRPGVAAPKLVGMSQRRTRAGSRFQCAVHQRWNPARLVAALALDEGRRRRAATALGDAVAEVSASTEAIVAALVERLPT